MTAFAYEQNCRRCLLYQPMSRLREVTGACAVDDPFRLITPKRVRRLMPVNWRCPAFKPREGEAG